MHHDLIALILCIHDGVKQDNTGRGVLFSSLFIVQNHLIFNHLQSSWYKAICMIALFFNNLSVSSSCKDLHTIFSAPLLLSLFAMGWNYFCRSNWILWTIFGTPQYLKPYYNMTSNSVVAVIEFHVELNWIL